MSMADDLREKVNKNKKDMNSKEGLAEAFNGVSLKLIKQFIGNVEAGSVQIDDVADLARLFSIFTDINDISTGAGEGNGTLPKMTSMQRNTMSEDVKLHQEGDEEDGEDYVDIDDLLSKNSDEIEAMLNKREMQMNKENEATM